MLRRTDQIGFGFPNRGSPISASVITPLLVLADSGRLVHPQSLTKSCCVFIREKTHSQHRVARYNMACYAPPL
jgi:hypothetical protein